MTPPHIPDLTIARGALITAAGFAAGFINSIVGSGTLISFPTLASIGFERVTANVANNIGLVPGSTSAAYGFRGELVGQRKRLMVLGPASGLGALVGSFLLLRLPSKAFAIIVPFLILLGVALVLLQPRIVEWVKARRADASDSELSPDEPSHHIGPFLWLAIFGAGVYGGYFGAAQGVLLIGIMGAFLHDELVRINAAKNVLSAIVGLVAGLVFMARTSVPWSAVALVALGSVTGGLVGARIGRRIPPTVLRKIVAAIGIIAATKFLYELVTK